MEIPGVAVEEISQSLNLHQQEEGPFRCSFCTKGFPTLQCLGGHQTTHRKEIKEMRLRHQHYMLTHQKRRAKKTIEARPEGKINITSKPNCLQMVPLSPNIAFWKAHNKLSREPKLHDFFDTSNHCADHVTDKTITHIYFDPLLHDEGLDLDLKL